MQSRTFHGTGCASDSSEFGRCQAAASKLPEGILGSNDEHLDFPELEDPYANVNCSAKGPNDCPTNYCVQTSGVTGQRQFVPKYNYLIK